MSWLVLVTGAISECASFFGLFVDIGVISRQWVQDLMDIGIDIALLEYCARIGLVERLAMGKWATFFLYVHIGCSLNSFLISDKLSEEESCRAAIAACNAAVVGVIPVLPLEVATK